jgi:hypothetical protein
MTGNLDTESAGTGGLQDDGIRVVVRCAQQRSLHGPCRKLSTEWWPGVNMFSVLERRVCRTSLSNGTEHLPNPLVE